MSTGKPPSSPRGSGFNGPVAMHDKTALWPRPGRLHAVGGDMFSRRSFRLDSSMFSGQRGAKLTSCSLPTRSSTYIIIHINTEYARQCGGPGISAVLAPFSVIVASRTVHQVAVFSRSTHHVRLTRTGVSDKMLAAVSLRAVCALLASMRTGCCSSQPSTRALAGPSLHPKYLRRAGTVYTGSS